MSPIINNLLGLAAHAESFFEDEIYFCTNFVVSVLYGNSLGHEIKMSMLKL